jgi:hypothetical protein
MKVGEQVARKHILSWKANDLFALAKHLVALACNSREGASPIYQVHSSKKIS